MKKLPFILGLIFLGFVFFSIIFYNYYALIANNSGHTGLNLMQIEIFYLLFSVFVAILAFIFKLDNLARKIFIVTSLLSLLFVLNVLIFEKTGVLLNYDDWLKRGM